VAQQWEASSQTVEELGVRRVVIRTGVVLSLDHGALPLMLLPIKLFAGGPLGSGRQWQPWIHWRDEAAAIVFLLHQPQSQGVFNLSAPAPVTNSELGKTAASMLGRPFWLPAPSFALRLLLGEMATLVLDGQRMLPERLLKDGFTFEYPEIKAALAELLRP
jgi:uncharacterized protein (TIGR01777 family)